MRTERLFFATSVLFNPNSGTTGQTGFSLTWSPDRGATWNYELIATDVRDWIKFYAGPPVTSTLEGYPSVIYASAPFGGIGNSGMGYHHGYEGFQTFSHARAIFRRGSLNAWEVMRPPYSDVLAAIVPMIVDQE